MPSPRRAPKAPFLRLVLGVVMACALGLHWIVIQGIAWTTMVVNYSSEGTLVEALEMAFDGDHSCPLCKAVQQGTQSDRDETAPSAAKSLNFTELRFSIVRIFPPTPSWTLPQWVVPVSSRESGSPEPPPPRAIIA